MTPDSKTPVEGCGMRVDDIITTLPEHLHRPLPGLTMKQVWPAVETVLLRNAAILELLDVEPVAKEALDGICAQLRQTAGLLQEVCS